MCVEENSRKSLQPGAASRVSLPFHAWIPRIIVYGRGWREWGELVG